MLFTFCSKKRKVNIDSTIFRLHYILAVFILILFSTVINYIQYFQSPINCNGSEKLVNDYCWLNSYIYGTKEDKSVKNETTKIYDHVNHWIGFLFIFQAVCFFFPHFLWKYYLEGGRMKSMIRNLSEISTDETNREIVLEKVEFFTQNLGVNRSYGILYICCEFTNFLNVVLQIVFTNWFLQGEFGGLGLKVFQNDILPNSLPKKVHCDYYTKTSSGQEMNVDILCTLPFNSFIEKVYIILWFWLIFLAIASGLQFIATLSLEFLPSYRDLIFKWKLRLVRDNSTTRIISKKSDSDAVDEHKVSKVELSRSLENSVRFGDWILLNQLAKNMDLADFGYLLKGLVRLAKGEVIVSEDGKGSYQEIQMDDFKIAEGY